MTFLQKAILNEVKEHNKNRDMGEFNKSIKFISLSRYNGNLDEFVVCSNGESLTRYIAKFRFKTESKYEANIVKYQVNIYSDGTTSIYFDGTEYEG